MIVLQSLYVDLIACTLYEYQFYCSVVRKPNDN